MARIPLRERRRLRLEAHMAATGVVVMEEEVIEEVVEVVEKPKPKEASKSKAKSKAKKKKGE